MSSQPKTKPETWVPAGAEKRDAASSTLEAPTEPRRKQLVARPPTPKAEHAPRLPRVRRHVTNLAWAAMAAAFPWIWFLVRDLTPVMQVVALALPALVLAALVGLAISALDERRLSSLLVAISVAAFGWVTIIGPRSALPGTPPADPIRIASIVVGTSNGGAEDALATLVEQEADLAVVVEPSKKARNPALRDRYPFTLRSGRFVVVSSLPVHALALPKDIPASLVLRFQVDRPGGAFVVYAVRTDGSLLDAALDDPIGIGRLRDAAADERLPVVMIGDFGVSDRSTQYRLLVPAFRDAMRSGTRAATTAATFPWDLLFVRTGFVLTSPDWCSNAGLTFAVQDAPTDGLAAAVGPCRR